MFPGDPPCPRRPAQSFLIPLSRRPERIKRERACESSEDLVNMQRLLSVVEVAEVLRAPPGRLGPWLLGACWQCLQGKVEATRAITICI